MNRQGITVLPRFSPARSASIRNSLYGDRVPGVLRFIQGATPQRMYWTVDLPKTDEPSHRSAITRAQINRDFTFGRLLERLLPGDLAIRVEHGQFKPIELAPHALTQTVPDHDLIEPFVVAEVELPPWISFTVRVRGRLNAKVTVGVAIDRSARDRIGDVVVGAGMARLSVGRNVFSTAEHLDFGETEHSS